MHSPGPSASDIQSHLYSSFLQASTYDVAIRVTGTWKAIYKLHRVVLIQSGFFRSLFTAGFSESSTKYFASRNGTDAISVVFDDFNITRPAFEVCISRLYGGGPILHVSPNIIPTTNHPLTPPFSGVAESEVIPSGHQPAGPRFLLSLLATAIYLSIPTVASQALSLILKTVGPTTVLQYLNFACGKSLSYSDPVLEESQPAVGLANVAFMLDEENLTSASVHPVQTSRSIEGLKVDSLSDSNSSEGDSPIIINTNDAGSLEPSDGELDDFPLDGPSHYYGAVSDKIGEACACWLARWATDMLQLEDRDSSVPQLDHTDSRARSNGFSSIGTADVNTVSSFTAKPPLIWGRGGLSAEWVAALVSADTLFVKDERERYNFARTVVELRRRQGILAEEENVWSTMFEHGIHYINMTFEDIHFISQDMSPTTKRPYIRLAIMQASHWSQSILRHHITSRPTTSTSSTSGGTTLPPSRDKELGITLTTADILTQLSEADQNEPYYPVFSDSSLRIGDGGSNPSPTPAGLSMEELFSASHQPSPRQPRPSASDTMGSSKISTTEDNFFGILTPHFVARTCVESDATGKARWSLYPPCRFAVEFWDVDLLKEKSRLHSQTIWHAGSLFNIYVQLVRKKGQAQLGIYLHRQSSVDPIPASSAPALLTQSSSRDGCGVASSERHLHHRQPSLPSLLSQAAPNGPNHYSPSIHPSIRSTTPSANTRNAGSPSPSPSSSPPAAFPFGYGPNPSTLTTPSPQQPYRDPRSCISAYFAISCASATGSSQTRFSSTPDVFSVSQSWGWKSSSLRTEEFLEVGTQPLPITVVRGKEVSLRATVVLGLV